MKTPWSDPISMSYHKKQWETPKQSTIEFEKFLAEKISVTQNVIDVGCGTGASTNYIASRNRECTFVGLDQDATLIQVAAETLNKASDGNNLRFEVGDCFDLSSIGKSAFDGVLSLQTLSWLESWEEPMKQIYLNLEPNWIGLSSLFYPGDISAEIRIFEPVRERVTNYNVISIKGLNRHANDYGYEVKKFEKFEISIDLPKPENEDVMGTYTLRTELSDGNSRLQLSGPIIMPWYFVLIEKIHTN